MSETSTAFIKSATSYCRDSKIDLVSVVLFGSSVKGRTSSVSDVDIIFIVDNDTHQGKINAFNRYLQDLEVSLGIRDSRTRGLARIMDQIGAQYKSVFVCRKNSFENGAVTEIFKSDSIFDSFILDNPLWATDIGLKNIILTAKVVSGQNLLRFLRARLKPVSLNDLRRNRRMYTALAIYGIIATPFLKNSTKYSMSSLKWALHSSYFGGLGKLGSLDDEVAYFKEVLTGTRIPLTLGRLLELRAEYRKSPWFNIRAYFAVRGIFNYMIKNGKFPVKLNAEGIK